MSRINSLEAENVKRIRAVKIEPTATGLTVVGGRNNQGKTSVLDAIAWATGRHISMKEYAGFLREQLKRVAALRGIAPHELERQMEHTLCTFLGSAPVIRRTFA